MWLSLIHIYQEYILIEVKYGKTKVPFGQRLAIERMVDDFTKIGKPAVAIVCEHTVKDADKHVVAAACKVREIYYGCLLYTSRCFR